MYKNIILPVFLYGCETWFFTVRENVDTVRLFDKNVTGRKLGPKEEEVRGT
jgi:hypothetical protein